MARTSAGLLLHRLRAAGLEVLLVHPGGPLWARKDQGAWSIPKGEHEASEDPLACAEREFQEELGCAPPARTDDDIDLGTVRQASGKRVSAWARRGDLDVATITSNTFEMEWPPRSGRIQAFPEVDRAAWFTIDVAREKANPAQVVLIDRLVSELDQRERR